jgi:hypothetical protein
MLDFPYRRCKMARGRPRGSRNKLPKELIGRNLSIAQLYLKPGKKVARLLIRGDRGVLDLKLTNEEVKELLDNTVGDTLSLSFILVEGTVAEFREQFQKVTEIIPEKVVVTQEATA